MSVSRREYRQVAFGLSPDLQLYILFMKGLLVRRTFSVLSVLLISSLILAAASGRKAQAAETIPLDPAVKTGVLPNGFTYYIRKNSEPQNRVVLYLANKVGSVLETDAQQGLAHFMEHMTNK